jgi:hypothetical protein
MDSDDKERLKIIEANLKYLHKSLYGHHRASTISHITTVMVIAVSVCVLLILHYL